MSATKSSNSNAVKQGVLGMFIGDAVSMPVHWYYDAQKIKEDYDGWITKYENPKDKHPLTSKGLTRPNPVTYNGKEINVVGDVILKDKSSAYNESTKAMHYHQGMKAGDNTLNCYTALLAIRTLVKTDDSASKEDFAKQFFSNYVKVMTTPASHPDIYAESHHRTFFTDWMLADSPTDPDVLYKFATERMERNFANPSADHPPYIGSFAIPIPVVLHYSFSKSIDEVIEISKEIYSRTHPVKEVTEAMENFTRLLYAVVHGASLKEEAEKAFVNYLGSEGPSKLEKFDKMIKEAESDKLSAFQSIGKELGLNCPAPRAYPIVLYLARYYHDDFEGGILANTNVGGDNCARGAPLGVLLGAALGAKNQKIPAKWTDPLVVKPLVDQLLPF